MNKKQLAAIMDFASTDTTRDALCAVSVTRSLNTTKYVATNSHILVEVVIDERNEDEFTVSVPTSKIAKAVKIADAKEMIIVNDNDITISDTSIKYDESIGKFPAYESFIDRELCVAAVPRLQVKYLTPVTNVFKAFEMDADLRVSGDLKQIYFEGKRGLVAITAIVMPLKK